MFVPYYAVETPRNHSETTHSYCNMPFSAIRPTVYHKVNHHLTVSTNCSPNNTLHYIQTTVLCLSVLLLCFPQLTVQREACLWKTAKGFSKNFLVKMLRKSEKLILFIGIRKIHVKKQVFNP